MIDATTTPVPLNETPTTIAASEDVAAKVYDAPPLEHKAYSAGSMYASSLESGLTTVAGLAGLDSAGRSQYLEEVSGLFQEFQIPPAEAGSIHDVIVQHLQKPASQEQIQKWNTEVEADGRYSWGAREYEQRVALVQQFLAKRPELRDRLARTGALAHPKVFRAALSAAHSLPQK
ncbi:MAG: hypothetical protein R3F24_13795 [Gammaproteobacteria bacterium]